MLKCGTDLKTNLFVKLIIMANPVQDLTKSTWTMKFYIHYIYIHVILS